MSEDKEVRKFSEMAKAGLSTKLDVVLEKREDIAKLSFEEIQKISSLIGSRASNGICGMGCESNEMADLNKR